MIVLGGGCFWCTEAVFQRLEGVTSVEPGYAGGDKEDPTYEEVCSGTTGHAEVVKVEYDPARVSLRKILKVFFSIHDPTQIDRQGHDIGTQYRSAIFYDDEGELGDIDHAIREAESEHGKHVVTQVEKLKAFYPAEDYHKNY